MLTIFSGQTQIVFAGGTFSVNVGFSIPILTLQEIEIFLWFINKFKKFFVFTLSFVNIS